MNLTPEELRVLACLIEKSHTTPDQYPLSSNALTSACNQKTSRDPVVDYPMKLVDETLLLLREGGWVRSVRSAGSRAFKHRHVIDEKLSLGPEQQAVMAVLALRGAQSAGELKTRTDRYVDFEGPEAVEEVLGGLAARSTPLVRNVGRASGQSQDRWIQLLLVEAAAGDDPAHRPATGSTGVAPVFGNPPGPSPTAGHGESAASGSGRETGADGGDGPARVDALEDRVAVLEVRLAALEAELGLEP